MHRALIVGSGIAGLTTALELGDCTVITRAELGAGTSRWAQGGIAASLGADDTPAEHAQDTIAVGGGLSLAGIVEQITSEAPARVRWLQQVGAQLDTRPEGGLALGQEAGHRRRRIVHAGGDATGAEVMRALVAAVRARPDIRTLHDHRVLDLVRSGDAVVGVLVVDPSGALEVLTARAVVLATGGIGRAYARTTNPPEVTGDGLAMAARAGAQIRDPEFVQFHPTALASSLDPVPLLTEALRGEGAHLVDEAGRRYLLDVHPDAELAPRDVVARANWEQQRRGPIYLDARGVGAAFPERFPTVFASAMSAGIDPRDEPIPTTPAQHYHVGGIRTDAAGRTSVRGLFACGEVASVGLHGSNRLASNSLLEGLVLGARVATAIRSTSVGSIGGALQVPACGPRSVGPGDPAAVERLRDLLWERGGLVRDAAGLHAALDELGRLAPRLERDLDGRNLLGVTRIVLRAALGRRESRGGHFRADHPHPAPGRVTHTVIREAPSPTVPASSLAMSRKAAS